jgi:hypothetical protein
MGASIGREAIDFAIKAISRYFLGVEFYRLVLALRQPPNAFIPYACPPISILNSPPTIKFLELLFLPHDHRRHAA